MASYPVPYFAEVNGGIPRGGEIELHGEVTSGAEQAIWFELRSNDGIPVHINVRFGRQGHYAAVFNSYEKGKWKHEDRHKMNFRPGQMIHIIVTNEMLHWKIQINGEKYNFSHRLSSSDISRLEIRGDLRLNSLNFRNLSGHVDSRPIPSSTYQPHFTPGAYEPSSFTDHSGGMIGAGGGNGPYGGNSGGYNTGSGGIGAGSGAGGYNQGQNYPGSGIGAGGMGQGGNMGAGIGPGGYGGSGGGIGAGGYGGNMSVGEAVSNLTHGVGVGHGGGGYPTGGGYAGGIGAGAGQQQYGQNQGYNQGPHPSGPPNYGNQPRPSGPY